MIIDIPSNVSTVRLSSGEWVDVPEEKRRIESSSLWNDGEEFTQATETVEAPVEPTQPVEAPVIEAEAPVEQTQPAYTPDIPFEQVQAINTKYENKLNNLNQLKQENEGDEVMQRQYDTLIANMPQEKYKEQQQAELDYLKLKTAKNKAQEQDTPVEDPIGGMEASATAFGISSYKFVEPLLGMLTVLSEDLENKVRDLVGAEQLHGARNWFAENQKTIADLEKRMGYEEGDIFTPSNIGSMGFNLVGIALPFLKGTKFVAPSPTTTTTKELMSSQLAHDLRVAATYETGAEFSKGVAEGETYGEAAERGTAAGGITMLGGKLIGAIINRIPAMGGEGKLYSRFKENLDMTAQEEQIYLDKYAKMMGVDAQAMNEGQKATAIAFGNPNAREILYQGLTKGDAQNLHSQFNKYAKSLGDDLQSKIDKADEVGVQTLVNEVDTLRGQAWDEFDNIIKTHYGDISVSLKGHREVIPLFQQLAGNDQQALGMIYEGKINLPMLKKLKSNFFNRFVKNKPSRDLTQAERDIYVKNTEIYGDLNKLYKEYLPETMHDSYDTLAKLEKMKAQANVKKLFSRFKYEDTNIEQKHLDTILREMKAKRKGSSYDSFISMMGKRTEASNKLEGELISNILGKQTKDGFVNFMKVYENVDSLQFKTPQGKALQGLMKEYKEVFANVEKVSKTVLSKESGENTLTMNPVMRAAYAIHAFAFKNTAQWLGVTKSARMHYVVKNLPKVLDMNTMPKGYTLREQRGAIMFSRFVNQLKEIGDQGAEEFEIGQKGGYYESSQMIGETGAQRIIDEDAARPEIERRIGEMLVPEDSRRVFSQGDINDPTEVKKTWEKTQWYFDQVDDSWKFHLDGKDVKIIAGKDKFFTEGQHKIEDLIDMPHLYEAYPELRKRVVYITSMADRRSLGYYSPSDGTIGLNRQYDWTNKGTIKPIKNIKETLVHEIQHAIQGLEGFAKGGNTGNLTYQQYLSLHGEVEARALTRGSVGKYPKELYKQEYTKEHVVGSGHIGEKIMKPLLTDQPNYRGVAPGSGEPIKKIYPKKGVWDD